MKIVMKEPKTTTLGDLSAGDCFRFDSHRNIYYTVIRPSDLTHVNTAPGQLFVLELAGGVLYRVFGSRQVIRVSAEVVIK